MHPPCAATKRTTKCSSLDHAENQQKGNEMKTRRGQEPQSKVGALKSGQYSKLANNTNKQWIQNKLTNPYAESDTKKNQIELKHEPQNNQSTESTRKQQIQIHHFPQPNGLNSISLKYDMMASKRRNQVNTRWELGS